MSEYIVNVPDEEAECFIARFGFENVKLFGYGLTGEIVRCRDCSLCVEKGHRIYCDLNAGGFPQVYPDGFCAWGENKEVHDGD